MADENVPVQHVTRLVVVTGASSGIGLAAAERLARNGDRVVLVGRDPARLDAAAERVARAASGRSGVEPTTRRPESGNGGPVSGATPAVFRADFAVLDQVRALAGALRDAYPRIDVLVNNAGAVFPRRVTTVDGFELTMQTNHLAPFLLTNLLADRVGRVVTTASRAHQQGRLDPDRLDSPGWYVPLAVYGTSKQANILFTAEAARRWPHIVSVCFHPGVVRTRFGSDNPLIGWYFRRAPWLRSPDRGADTLCWLATAPATDLVDGGYYVDRRPRRPTRSAADPALAARLWEASRRAVGC